VPACLPEWLVHLLALIIRFLLERQLARGARLPSWWHDRPDLPPGSAQAVAASVRGAFGNAIAWMCLRRGIGPTHPDWPYLSHTIVSFGGSLNQFRAGMPAWGLHWWEHPEIVPGVTDEIRPTPAADAMARALARQETANTPPPGRTIMPAEPRHDRILAPARAIFPRATTGPPTGPPLGRIIKLVTTIQRGQPMAGPAVLIRAAAIPQSLPLAA
jgi:hypothetical protein